MVRKWSTMGMRRHKVTMFIKKCLGMNQTGVKQEFRWDKGRCSGFDWDDNRVVLRTMSQNKLS